MTDQTLGGVTGFCKACNKEFRRLASGFLTPHYDAETQRDCPGGYIAARKPHSMFAFKRIPGSRFAICGGCQEEHLLTKNDVMSIHENNEGQRCEGSTSLEQILELRFVRTSRPKEGIVYEEIDDSGVPIHVWAETNKNRRQLEDRDRRSKNFDRSIYAVKNVHTVHGGNPTLGRRAR